MNEYSIYRIYNSDKTAMRQLNELLKQENISLDRNLEYTVGLYEGKKLIATGSFFRNTLRCLAVDSLYRGEGLLNTIVSHLVSVLAERGIFDLFLYTKCDKKKMFESLGFTEIRRVEPLAIFMENRSHGFQQYLKRLSTLRREGTCVAVVVNANPFTLGHQYLIEKASAENDFVHLFVVSEDASLVPADVRMLLVQRGVAHLPNVIVHSTGDYMISSATFPSYFIKDEADVSKAQAQIDIAIFTHIAKTLNISVRYVGEEPFSQVTEIYNEVMREELAKANIGLVIVPRRKSDGKVISASSVRLKIQQGDFGELKGLVPRTTYDYFTGKEGEEIVKRIQKGGNVIHH